MSLFDVVPSSVGFDAVEWFCFSYSSICVESFSLFTCVLISMGFAFYYVNLAVMFWRNSWYCFWWFRNGTTNHWEIYVCKNFRNCFSVNTGG